MEIFTVFVIVVSLIMLTVEVTGIKKAIQEDYDSKFITLYRGWNVAALLNERDVRDGRVKKLLLIHNSVNLLLLFVVDYLYFSEIWFSDYSFTFTFSVLLISYLTRLLIDWRIKEVIKEQMG
ncbi:hypothetical protein [Alkalibacterium sp. 20]|uniref:hypothetical protein n=1 Tax=Alkalibacterium sp. 20 TaxID=1798803 RepID=UPI0008FFF522|nr:hypothetical protein [Alkalibacterium sp. 20]OJF91200.1 hypothetical protein AX762_11190 [Alkalibacterium sp. 20]